MTIPGQTVIHDSDLEVLCHSLKKVWDFWSREKIEITPLVSVYYKSVVAKSNRMARILSEQGKSPNDTIVGAKFTDDKSPKHIITHCVSQESILEGIMLLEKCAMLLKDHFESEINSETLTCLTASENALLSMSKKLKGPFAKMTEDDAKGKLQRILQWRSSIEAILKHSKLSKSLFAKVMRDAAYISRFGVEETPPVRIQESQIVTLYDTGLKFSEILLKVGMKDDAVTNFDDVTWLVTPEQYSKLASAAPYLISMHVSNLVDLQPITGIGPDKNTQPFSIPKPTNEPIIGVIDTMFDIESAYFSDWVEFHCEIHQGDLNEQDSYHGTAVSSILVDGPALNPVLDDGCGRFRVRHFGVARHGKNSTTQIMRKIQLIVESNKDIKVWNLSLGSMLEIDPNFISPEAALLDAIQFENDVLFVVSGTNNNNPLKSYPRIGAPADSLNSVVVNSATFDMRPANYSRNGLVLSFFNKPDVSAFGGDEQDGIVIYSTTGRQKISGTSFAAPWVTRKLAYLIYIMKFPREVAKAIVLDAAAGWKQNPYDKNLIGFGIVPIHIKDILETPDDEIKFVIHDISEAYETYAYTIPVPKNKEKFPYVAKATLCYFPECSRQQGVDYTNTELDIHFGRLNKKGKVKSIDNNVQGESEFVKLYEPDARRLYRKWDNVKHISEGVKDRALPKKQLNEHSDMWGISIKMKERLNTHSGKGIRFGVVVTLKELNGINRCAEFVKLCRANSWFVNEIDIHARAETYARAEEEVIFD